MTTDISTYRFNHTMIRVKDSQVSLKFYEEMLGMKFLHKVDFPTANFREAVLELTHYWGTESDPNHEYHNGNGNKDLRGFGHLAILVDNLEAACKRFEDKEVKFIKKLEDGAAKTIAFISDPDGYWIELIQAGTNPIIKSCTV
ncbi:hypothetical protein RclHR1_02150001 [Rhizophagus clarus]|uniref:Lactoylglutathione lyase n=1 Tax=Rhizophagus clarus TaxID=94130 RepID=A0A2Z6R6C4_9GLOM|nr:hypothetical protein RclHR1_02150001 [Rhizophagus clarus]GES93791.1 lactoylglutathione lyase [Rhizophagus clarus]